ncbi:hypothetical protein [uncultured Ruegeria sp.]|uniref:hypothetical protein n=1 Tax=uncultured Ruegeria sp. TaxID=259304 RepID=UPI00260187B5|nr:hypothetical protein [uncultured Ruegeria sp.]
MQGAFTLATITQHLQKRPKLKPLKSAAKKKVGEPKPSFAASTALIISDGRYAERAQKLKPWPYFRVLALNTRGNNHQHDDRTLKSGGFGRNCGRLKIFKHPPEKADA